MMGICVLICGPNNAIGETYLCTYVYPIFKFEMSGNYCVGVMWKKHN